MDSSLLPFILHRVPLHHHSLRPSRPRTCHTWQPPALLSTSPSLNIFNIRQKQQHLALSQPLHHTPSLSSITKPASPHLNPSTSLTSNLILFFFTSYYIRLSPHHIDTEKLTFHPQKQVAMAPANSKTNFKSFDVQARLLRAIVAAHPEVKWNYKGKLSLLPLAFCAVLLSLSPSLPLLLHETSMLASSRLVDRCLHLHLDMRILIPRPQRFGTAMART